jgi:hypothetical protein
LVYDFAVICCGVYIMKSGAVTLHDQKMRPYKYHTKAALIAKTKGQ